jgi:hypothetical protein
MGNKQIHVKGQYIVIILVVVMTSINIAAWNMRSLTYAQTYINDLCTTYDIICASEHRLYNYELNKLNSIFQGYAVLTL